MCDALLPEPLHSWDVVKEILVKILVDHKVERRSQPVFHGSQWPFSSLFHGFSCCFDVCQAGFEAFRAKQEALLELANSEADCDLGRLGDFRAWSWILYDKQAL